MLSLREVITIKTVIINTHTQDYVNITDSISMERNPFWETDSQSCKIWGFHGILNSHSAYQKIPHHPSPFHKSLHIYHKNICLYKTNLAKFNIATNMIGPEVEWSLIYWWASYCIVTDWLPWNLLLDIFMKYFSVQNGVLKCQTSTSKHAFNFKKTIQGTQQRYSIEMIRK